MGGWTGQGKDDVVWDGTIYAKRFRGDGSALTGITVTETDPTFQAASAAIIAHMASGSIHFTSGAIYTAINKVQENAEDTSGAFLTHQASYAIHFTSGALWTKLNSASGALDTHISDSSDPHGSTLTQTNLSCGNYLSSGTMNFKPSGDTDDYLTMKTASNICYIGRDDDDDLLKLESESFKVNTSGGTTFSATYENGGNKIGLGCACNNLTNVTIQSSISSVTSGSDVRIVTNPASNGVELWMGVDDSSNFACYIQGMNTGGTGYYGDGYDLILNAYHENGGYVGVWTGSPTVALQVGDGDNAADFAVYGYSDFYDDMSIAANLEVVGATTTGTVIYPPTDTQTIDAASDTILVNATYIKISNTTAGSITLTSNPTILDDITGRLIILSNVGSKDIVLTNGNNLALAGGANLTTTPGSFVQLLFDGTVWRQITALLDT